MMSRLLSQHILSAPTKLRVNAYHVQLAADGNHLWAQIRDEATGNLDGQVLRRPTPEALDIDTLRTNPVLFDQLFNQLGGAPITLELLLAEGRAGRVTIGFSTTQVADKFPVRSS